MNKFINTYSDTRAWINYFGTQGNVSYDQNPVKAVRKTEKSSSSEIVDLTEFGFGKLLRTIVFTKTIEANVVGPAFSNVISEVKTTETSSVSYQSVEERGENLLLLLESPTSPIISEKSESLKLSGDYDTDLKKLPKDLADAVKEANEKNAKISENALKGVNENLKKVEKNADDGKWIEGKGKYYDSNNTPGN